MNRLLLHVSVVCLFTLLALQNVNAQAFLVKDINPGVGWSSIDFKFRIGDNFYFVANSDAGRELWISDGTPNGTLILKDINPGPFNGSDPDNFILYNGTWYFTADEGANGTELWQTDGTEAGTVLFADIQAGPVGSDPSNFSIINGLLYFTANDGINGMELWKSNGTLAGTSMIADVFPGISGSSPEYMTALGSDIVFVANDGANGDELWKTDGTVSGTVMIKDIVAGISSSFPTDLTTVGNKVYFIADDGVTGKEIWRTDGTNTGTELTTDIVAGPGHPQASDLHAVGNYLFFVADNGTNGIELFRSDANAVPALSEIVEIFPDTFGSTPSEFIMLNGDLIFNANSGVEGYEIWKASASDGSVTMIKDIFPGFGSSSPNMLAVLNNELIFKARGELIGFEVWKTDGTEAGTVLLGDLNTDPSTNLSNSDATRPVIKDNVLYFTATDYINGFQIWRTDGSTSSTQRLTSIPHDTIFNNTHKPYFINNIGNEVINFVGLSGPYGEELWGFDVDPVSISGIQTNSPLNCNGDTNGTIDVTVSGGVGDPSCFNYSWNVPGLTGLNLTGLAAGSYTLTVTDCVGFETITTITIEQPDLVSGTTQQTSEVSCAGGNDGQASVSGAGGTSPYNYQWQNGQTGPTVALLSAGTHSVTITDNQGCTGVETVVITEPTPVTVTANAGPSICFGANDGQATVNPGGGNPGYSYLWDNAENGATATMLTGGNHSVTVTDLNGCTATTTVFITEFSQVDITFNTSDVSCINGSNGSATAIPSGGSGSGYTFLWSDASTNATINNLGAGEYCVTVTDDNSCTSSACTTILTPIISTSVINNVSCFGGADGSATVNIINANSIYTYLWDNGEVTATATMLNAGMHNVTITDGLACSSIQNLIITEAPEFVFVDSLSASPSCFEAADGLVTYNFSGGTAPYSYTWSTGAMTSTGTLTGLSGGATYCATITDANNCVTYNFCSTLEEPEEIVPSLSGVADATCFDICNGTAIASVSSGLPTTVYIYTWSSGEESGGTTSTASNLCAGINTVTIFDGFCSVVDTFMIDQPSAIVPEIAIVDATCFGDTDGSVSVMASGGAPAYSYSFSDGDSGLSAGTYTVTVTDDNSCQVVESFTVGEPDSITLTYMIQTPSCIGDSDGIVTPVPSGGNGGYSFEYSAGPTDLSAGTYMITVTDVNSCMVTDSFTVSDPTPIEIINTINNISCGGAGDGSVVTSAVGGSGNYTFEYSDGSDGLEAGTYMVTATDGNGCVAIDSFSITEPDTLTTGVIATNISCNGAADGMVAVTAEGGTMPYSFEYSNGFENLQAGTYSVTTTDDNGCVQTDTFVIIEPEPLEIGFTIVNPISCFGASDGILMVELTGGTLPYNYDSLYTDLSADVFQVIYSDANGCGGTIPFSLSQPDEIVLTTTSTDATEDQANGTATVTPNGGIMPHTFEWNTNPVQTTQTATGLLAGDYEVTVTDADGCTSIATVTVGIFIHTNDLDESIRFELYPNPANNQVVLDLAFSKFEDVDLKIYDALGRMVYYRDIDIVQEGQEIINLDEFVQGVYWVQLSAENAQYVKRLSVVKR